MTVLKSTTVPLHSEADIVQARQAVRAWATEQAFSLVEQTKIVTAASELARNTVTHGKGGVMQIEALTDATRKGLRLTFTDEGPGIPNVELALQDGYTTANGLGLGLGGARRLSNDFDISSTVGKGTRVTVTRWR
jgi:serine/threonine-protein kinase RsbT